MRVAWLLPAARLIVSPAIGFAGQTTDPSLVELALRELTQQHQDAPSTDAQQPATPTAPVMSQVSAAALAALKATPAATTAATTVSPWPASASATTRQTIAPETHPPTFIPREVESGLLFYGVLVTGVLAWAGALVVARSLYFAIGRRTGFPSAPEHFALFLRAGIPWRPVFEHVIHPVIWWLRQVRNKTTANAGWASLARVMCEVFRRGEGIPLGRLVYKGINLLQPIGYRGALHVNIIGPSGSGKTATFIAWLGTLASKASAFWVDCDGQIINAIGEWLQRTGHKLVCLDPNHLTRYACGGWNALAEFTAAEKRQGRAAVAMYAKALGEGLVRIENHLQPTFDNGARDFIVALCLFVWLNASPTKKNLAYVRHLLCCGLPTRNPNEDPFDVLLFEMSDMVRYDDGCGGKLAALIANGAAQMRKGQNQNGGNPFLGSAMRATSWLDLPWLAELSERSDFLCEDLKKGNVCVAMVAPLTDIQSTYSGWVRALTVMTAYTFQNIPGRLKTPCAMLIDEASSLGRLELLEVGSPGFRKYGIRLALGFQDLPAIKAKAAYPDTYQQFLSNAGRTLWIGSTDPDTLHYISDTLGRHTRREKIPGTPWYLLWLPRSLKAETRYQNFERLLKDPQQVKDALDVEHGMMIVTGKMRPFIAAIDPYWKALPVTRYTPDQGYSEAFLRARTRCFLAWLQERRAARKLSPSQT